MPHAPDGTPFDVPMMGSVFFGPGSGSGEIGSIEPGEFRELQLRTIRDGKSKLVNLDETELRPWMPFLNALISNQGASAIRVQFGDQRHFSLVVNPRRSVPLSDEPFTRVTFENIGTETINAGEVALTLSNDMASILRYVEMCEKGLLRPLVLPLTIRRAGDPRRVIQ